MNLYNVTIYIYIFRFYIFIYFNLQTVQGSFLPTKYLCNFFDSLHLLVPKNTIYIFMKNINIFFPPTSLQTTFKIYYNKYWPPETKEICHPV